MAVHYTAQATVGMEGDGMEGSIRSGAGPKRIAAWPLRWPNMASRRKAGVNTQFF
jgi:hypothetical protein